MEKLKKFFLNYKTQFNNFISLVILQGVNYILPLITFPYLFKTLGVNNFGLLSFSTAILFYFQIFIDFGFNLSGTRQVAINKEDNLLINNIVSSIIYCKLFLSFLSFIILVICIIFIDKLNQSPQLYLYSFLAVFLQSFLLNWFYQGIEKMKNLTIINVLTKLLSTVLIFVFVKNSNDIEKVPLFYSIGNFISVIVSFYIMYQNFRVRLVKVELSSMFFYLKESFPLFISNLSVTLYTFTTTIILGFFSSDTIVGYYTLAERIVAALKSIINPISQTLYPFLSIKAIKNKEEVLKFNYRFIKFGASIMFLICFLVFIILVFICVGVSTFGVSRYGKSISGLVCSFSKSIKCGISYIK